MAIILCLETATDICSVALTKDGHVLHHETLEQGQRHSAQLTLLIDRCLSKVSLNRNDLSAVAISNGPGSYTGLRVGASTAKAIAYALEIPMIAISTLESLADAYIEEQRTVVSSIDARRMEAYIGIFYKGRQLVPITNIIWDNAALQKLVDTYGDILICGNGIEKTKKTEVPIPTEILIAPSQCDARLLSRLANQKFLLKDFVNSAYHAPFYFKSPNITTPKARFKPL